MQTFLERLNLMDIDPTIMVIGWIGFVNLLWLCTYLVRPQRRPQSRNKWIESRSRSDSK